MPTLDELKNKDLYEILNVSRNASTEVIKESYKEIAKIYHPDSNYYADIISVPLTPEQEEIFKIITAAYNTLITPEKRAQYDDLSIKNLKTWEDDDEFWDYKNKVSELQSLKSKTSTSKPKTTLVNLKHFGRINSKVPIEEEVEEEIYKETFLQRYSLWITGALFLASGIGVLVVLLK